MIEVLSENENNKIDGSDDGSEGEGNSGRVVKVLKKIEIFFAEFDVVQCLVCFSVWSHPSPQVLSLLKY